MLMLEQGFGVGPIMCGPLSEAFGRTLPLFSGYFIFCIMQIPIAVAQNLQTIMIIRFLGGVSGSAPIAIIAGIFADVYGPVHRGIAISVFSTTVFLGPALGPVVGSFITESYLGWRWTAYFPLMLSVFSWTLVVLLVPETYAPVLLQRRAKRLRYQTRIWSIHSKMDEQEINIHSLVVKFLIRPFIMLLQEPILFLTTMYLALIYGILYLFFEAFPITFHEERGWKPTIASLPFISLAIGLFIGGGIAVWTTAVHFKVKVNNGTYTPEDRLPAMIFGGLLLPIGLFWFAWTSDPSIIWVPQVISAAFIGAGIMLIFLQGLNYVVDVYLMLSNSAIAANTICRSIFAAAFPLFATAMWVSEKTSPLIPIIC